MPLEARHAVALFMNVLLSGTSNSVLVNGLRKAFETSPHISRFANHSHGYSGSIAIGDHLRNIDFSNFDYCVIDYCVNEELLLEQGESRLEDAGNNMAALLDRASRAGCRPVILILPAAIRKNAQRPYVTYINRHFRDIGIPVLNIYEVVAMMGIDFESVFLDPVHLKRDFAALIGAFVIDQLREMEAEPAEVTEHGTYAPLQFLGLDRLKVSGARNVVTRSTRLLHAALLSIPPGTEIEVETEGVAELAGISFNLGRSVGALSAVREVSILNVQQTHFFSADRGLTLVSWPFSPVCEVAGQSALIRYACDREQISGDLPPTFEILGIVAKMNETRPLRLLASSASFRSLEMNLADRHLAGFRKALQV